MPWIIKFKSDSATGILNYSSVTPKRGWDNHYYNPSYTMPTRVYETEQEAAAEVARIRLLGIESPEGHKNTTFSITRVEYPVWPG